MRKSIAAFGALAALALSSCINSTPVADGARFFVPVAPEKSLERLANAPRTGIRAVELPDYLRGPKIALRRNGAEIVYSDFNLWGERLESAATRLITERLSARLGAENVDRYPWAGSACPVQVTVQFDRFEGDVDGSVHVSGRVVIEAQDVEGYPRTLAFKHDGTWDGTDWASLARSLGEAIDKVCEDIAKALPEAE
ncbi:MAG: membrane integrity-associated transporter subunit PqiC [Opitutales bacterium]|nr:membrane integrity-associated transporter subunit PqiC [Opitutales bacterium]